MNIILHDYILNTSKKIVCAHELGHDSMHRHLAQNNYLKEFMLYDMKSKPEYEANMFAAELLLDDDEVNTALQMGYDFFQSAKY